MMSARNLTYSKLIAVLATIIVIASYSLRNDEVGEAERALNIYGFNATDIDGKAINMNKYAGKVLLIVNVASE